MFGRKKTNPNLSVLKSVKLKDGQITIGATNSKKRSTYDKVNVVLTDFSMASVFSLLATADLVCRAKGLDRLRQAGHRKAGEHHEPQSQGGISHRGTSRGWWAHRRHASTAIRPSRPDCG